MKLSVINSTNQKHTNKIQSFQKPRKGWPESKHKHVSFKEKIKIWLSNGLTNTQVQQNCMI